MFINNGKGDYKEISDGEFFNSYQRSNKHVLAIDFDGVWVASEQNKSRLFKEKGYNIAPEDTSRDDVIATGVPMDDYIDVSVKAGIQIVEKGVPELKIDEYWPKLRAISNMDIFIVTSRYDKMVEAMIQYIQMHNTHVEGIFNVNNIPKKDILSRLKPDAFIDDIPSKLYELFENPNECTILNSALSECDMVLFRNCASLNKDIFVRGKIIDLKGGWDKFYQYLEHKFID